MFPTSSYVLNSISLAFPRNTQIRRRANDFEEVLTGAYSVPQVMAIPDEVDPEFPRIVFTSQHGYSQIIISQINISLNVKYSPDWQTNSDLRRNYLLERINLLFNLLDSTGIHPDFCGISTVVRLATEQNDTAILNHIATRFLRDTDIRSSFEILVKRTKIQDDRFYSHITVHNYRTSEVPLTASSIPRFSLNQATEKGIEITGDFNDRFAYNERDHYHTNRDTATLIISQGIEQIESMIHFIKEDA